LRNLRNTPLPLAARDRKRPNPIFFVSRTADFAAAEWTRY
jgi:hypothetical protein